MAIIKKRGLGINVVEAAKERIVNIFKSGQKIYVACSGGKDSIILLDLVYKLVLEGQINPQQLEVQFIDEELIYDCVEKIVMDWRKKFLLAGVTFSWFAVECRNYNCLNSLEDDENFIAWDRYRRSDWARKMPKFAITTTPYLSPRKDKFQDFLAKNNADGITLTGVRMAESINRLYYIARIMERGGITVDKKMYPVYDWKDSDVWKYIKDNNLDFPEVYMYMWESGVSKRQLRLAQFFAIDSCRCLSKMYEYYPGLMERVLKREPNAYLVQLYWDTNMFRRTSKTRQELEKDVTDDKDYKKLLIELVNNPKKVFKNEHSIATAANYRKAVLQHGEKMRPEHFKKLYEALLTGDTKGRSLRAIITNVVRTQTGGWESDYEK